MTVKELITELQKMDENMPVMIHDIICDLYDIENVVVGDDDEENIKVVFLNVE